MFIRILLLLIILLALIFQSIAGEWGISFVLVVLGADRFPSKLPLVSFLIGLVSDVLSNQLMGATSIVLVVFAASCLLVRERFEHTLWYRAAGTGACAATFFWGLSVLFANQLIVPKIPQVISVAFLVVCTSLLVHTFTRSKGIVLRRSEA